MFSGRSVDEAEPAPPVENALECPDDGSSVPCQAAGTFGDGSVLDGPATRPQKGFGVAHELPLGPLVFERGPDRPPTPGSDGGQAEHDRAVKNPVDRRLSGGRRNHAVTAALANGLADELLPGEVAE